LRPFFAIADQLGGDWPRWAREAAIVLSGEAVVTDEEDLASALIADIAEIFEVRHLTRIATRDLVPALVAVPESPWATANRGRRINDRYVSNVLGRFGVKPKEWQEGPRGFRQHRRGYVAQDLLRSLRAIHPDTRDRRDRREVVSNGAGRCRVPKLPCIRYAWYVMPSVSTPRSPSPPTR